MIDHLKKERLHEHVDALAHSDCLLAFSGGADSALVLVLMALACAKQGTRLFAIYIRTALMPTRDEAVAEALANKLGVRYDVLEVNEWEVPEIVQNTPDRCYYCKRKLFETLRAKADELGIAQVIDGTNHDDLQCYRPGLRAIRELGILSPLAQCGITKQDVRAYLQELGLEVAKRPSSPCLATRIPYGTMLDIDVLRRIEMAEQYLSSIGCYNVRVRLHGDVARVEVDEADMNRVLQVRGAIVERFKSLGFLYVSMDLEGFRSGSLDVKLEQDR